MVEDNLRRVWFRIDRGAIHGIASRGISAIGPIENSILQVQLQVDRLRQPVKEHFDVAAIGCALTLRDFDARAADLPQSRVVQTFVRPVDMPALGIDRDTDAPFQLIGTGACIPLTRIDQGLELRAVETYAHDSHPLAIAPIKFAVLSVDM